jgi:dihydrofolate reductase
MSLIIIAALDSNGLIGNGNALPWPHIKADMKHFRDTTLGHPIIMGRKTFESIGKALPGRRNIVLTRSDDFTADNITVVHSLEALLDLMNNQDAFIIGGREIYQQLLPYTDKMILTRIDNKYKGDVFFPNFDKADWEIITEPLFTEDGIALTIETLHKNS